MQIYLLYCLLKVSKRNRTIFISKERTLDHLVFYKNYISLINNVETKIYINDLTINNIQVSYHACD